MALDVGFSLLGSSVRSHVSPAQSAESWSGFVRLQERTANGWQHVQRIELADFWGTEATAKERLGAILRALEQPSSALSDRILTIPAMRPDGFDVELYIHDTGIDGYFGGLTQEFETLGEAMTWVRRALSNSYRLRTINKSRSDCRASPCRR